MNFSIGIFDQPKNGEKDEQEIVSDTHSTILDVIAQLKHPDYEFIFDADGVLITPFTEWSPERLAGWFSGIFSCRGRVGRPR